MNFGKFIRKFSTDPESENPSNRESIISGTSKLFDSVNSRTTNLVSGISSTFEQIKRRTSVETLSYTDKEGSKLQENDHKTKDTTQSEIVDGKLPYQDAKSYVEQANSFHNAQRQHGNNTPSDRSSSPNKKCPPPKPPPPLTKQMSTPHEDDRSQNRETFSRSQTVVDRHYADEIHDNEYLTLEGGQLADEVLEEAKSHLEMECQKIVSAMDDLMSFDPISTTDSNIAQRSSSPSEYDRMANQRFYGDRNNVVKPSYDADDISEQQKDFMDSFISDIYREEIAQIDETSWLQFKNCIQTRYGRVWLTRIVEKYQYLNSKEVPETIFYRLLQIFTIVLLECHEHEDYIPARDMMLVAFGCYATIRTLNRKTTYNFYLSSFISCHPIWKSIEFWNVCFSNAVQEVRSKRATTRRNSTNTTDADGVAFHQLQVYLNYMRSLGLPVELCSGFVRKQVNIVNLTDDEMRRLTEVMDSWKE